MKKLLASLLMGCLVFGLVACGSSANNAPAGENDVVVDNQVETEPATEIETEPVDVPEVEDTEVVEEVETPVEEVVYTYADLAQTMYAKSAVNVRDLPSTDGNRLGSLGFAQEVAVTGKCNETGWYRISFGDAVAYVSNNYLLNEKPEPQPVASEPVVETSAEPEVVLEKAPWNFYEPVYSMEWDCMIFYCPESEVNTRQYNVCYTDACQIIKWHSGANDCYNMTIPVGTYAEGNIIMVLVHYVK